MILALDPGMTESGYVVLDKGRVIGCGTESNESILLRIHSGQFDHIAIERFEARGMAVGMDSVETIEWVGRFWEAAVRSRIQQYDMPTVSLVFRRHIKIHWCETARAKDSNVRAAILDAFGGEKAAKGCKAAPGPLYGVSGHAWPALALALMVSGVGAEVRE